MHIYMYVCIYKDVHMRNACRAAAAHCHYDCCWAWVQARHVKTKLRLLPPAFMCLYGEHAWRAVALRDVWVGFLVWGRESEARKRGEDPKTHKVLSLCVESNAHRGTTFRRDM